MSNFSFSFYLNAYSDSNASNAPSRNNFKWMRNINGLPVSNPTSVAFELAPGESRTLFSGTRTLSQDGTTEYSISLKPFTSNTYILSWVGGTAPNFRTPRTVGSDATTEVNVALNGPVATFTSVPLTFASFNGQVAGMTTNILITAVTGGTGGNSVVLTGDGTSSITTLIAAWNTANPSNTIALTYGDGTQIPSSGATITLTGGSAPTQFNLISGGVQVGDYVRIGDEFNSSLNVFSQNNWGEFQIIALTATSFSINNGIAVAEGPITLGSDFANQIQIYSAQGVQIGDTLEITGGFSPVTQGSYSITDVAAEFLEFYSTNILPQESDILTDDIAVYSLAKRFIYLEADQLTALTINGVAAGSVKPFIIGTSVCPGVFVRTDTIFSISVLNNSLNTANLFLATVE